MSFTNNCYKDDAKKLFKIRKNFIKDRVCLLLRDLRTPDPQKMEKEETAKTHVYIVKIIQRMIEETPERTVRKMTNDFEHSVSKTSVYRMLHFYCFYGKFTHYTVSIMQHLKLSDIASRLQFDTDGYRIIQMLLKK